MAAAYEPRSSLRSSQQHHRMSRNNNHNNSNYNDLDANSSLPSIDFGFDDLRRRMGSFTTRFDESIAAGRQSVLAERNAHRTALSELHEDVQLRARNISLLQSQQNTHASTLQKEAAETAEMNAAVAQLSGQREEHTGANKALAREIETTRQAIKEREVAQRDYAEKMASQSRLNAPELAFYEDYLGLRIESPADDEITFIFTCVDDKDPERDFEVTIDLGRRDYAIKSCQPKLNGEKLNAALDRLNEARDLAPFLKEVRRLFQLKSREGRA